MSPAEAKSLCEEASRVYNSALAVFQNIKLHPDQFSALDYTQAQHQTKIARQEYNVARQRVKDSWKAPQ